MFHANEELTQLYLAECEEHLAALEKDLLALEKHGVDADSDLVHRAFRAMHSVKGGAGSLELLKIEQLAHRGEDVLELIRSGEMLPTTGRIAVLLEATDKLRELTENLAASNEADISSVLRELTALLEDQKAGVHRPLQFPHIAGSQTTGMLRMLLAEDDFVSRVVLQTFLSRYGECHIAVNGKEAVAAVHRALEDKKPYDLICMDIMMPEMDGREAVRLVRAEESSRGIHSTQGAKIIMTTAVDDMKEVIRCFRELCDGYLTKPVDLRELLGQMKSYQLVA